MKNIYNITKWQLISMWIFGILAVFLLIAAEMDQQLNHTFVFLFFVGVPFFLVFYTIGWRKEHCKCKE